MKKLYIIIFILIATLISVHSKPFHYTGTMCLADGYLYYPWVGRHYGELVPVLDKKLNPVKCQ